MYSATELNPGIVIYDYSSNLMRPRSSYTMYQMHVTSTHL